MVSLLTQPSDIQNPITPGEGDVAEGLNQDLMLFLEAFASFNTAGEKLNRASADLEKRLENVNQELERANVELSRSLEEKEQLHHHLISILQSMTSGVVAVDLNGKITLFNQLAEELTGIRADAVIGGAYENIFSDRPFLINTLKTLEPCMNREAFIQKPDAREPVPVEISTTLIQSATGEALGALEIIRDLSERKALEEQLGRAKALAELGKMASEVAHDLRNPLGAIRLYAGMLQQELIDNRRQLADAIVEGINSLEFITYNLLSLGRPIKPNFQFIDLVDVVRGGLAMTAFAMEEKDITLIQDFGDADVLICYGDFEQLKQVLLNLILNAIQAMPNGGQLGLIGKTESHRDTVTLCVEDNGCGIPLDIQEKIFTPFFTTKRTGTGLGLHTVNRIVQAHYGSIRVQSQEGVGTKFLIELPRDARHKQAPIFLINDALVRKDTA